ncbi:hypothetical protein MJM83_31180, partial [Salmonella enterica subsp. enterica serovar Montevideo]|nr:hypothetical protein [Salmonella enterica subsp. enterica serovar Montevideo]
SLIDAHWPLIEHIKNGVVRQIYTSGLRGKLGEEISAGLMENPEVLAKVKADKALEANNGHDGTWIAHPGLADTAMAVFNEVLGE